MNDGGWRVDIRLILTANISQPDGPLPTLTQKTDQPCLDHIRNEAATWFSRIELDRADLVAFECWRTADPRHAIAYTRVVAAWYDVGVAGGLAKAQPISSRPLSRRAALAAIIVGGAVITGGGLIANQALARPSARTKVGERRMIRLAGTDSRIMLNTDSHIYWQLSGEERSVWLDRGEIALTLNEGSQLTVHGGGTAIGLGPGHYNVRLDSGMLDLSVIAGRASFDDQANGESAFAVEGERVILADRPLKRSLDRDQAEALLAWPKGEILFTDTTLSSAVADYNRYLDRKIVIADDQLRDLRIGGRFETARPEPFLKALQQAFPIRTTNGKRSVILMSQN